MIEETALDGVEERFSVKLNRKNISYPKYAFKGKTIPALIIRKEAARACTPSDDHVADTGMETYLSNKLNQIHLTEKSSKDLRCNNIKSELVNDPDSPTTPQYSIKYRQAVSLDDYHVISMKSANIRPTEMVIDVHLPNIDCASQLYLDISNQTLTLTSVAPNPPYSLKVGLTFPVNNCNGNAQFDKTTRHLIVTLPVIPYTVPEEVFRESPQPEEHKCFNENENLSSSKGPDTTNNYTKIPFHFNQSSDSLAFIVDVPNTDQSSVQLDCCECGKSAKMEFWSIDSDNMAEQHYMLCLRFHCSIEPSSKRFDVTTQNLVVKFTKASPGVWNTFSSSDGGRDWIENSFLTRENMLGHLENLQKETDHSIGNSRPLENINVHVRNVCEENVTIEVQVPDECHFPEEKVTSTLSSSLSSQDGREFSKPRNDSESSEECTRQNKRGILKYSNSWRSISESSDDLSGNQDFLSSDAEWSSESLTDKSKKMVRFNDNISRNIFRPNSSILGQKRKNQKRSQYKKKRNSGSESEPSEEIGDSAEGFSSMSESELGIDEPVADKTWIGLSPISEKNSPAEIPKRDGPSKDVPHKTLDFRTSKIVASQDTTDTEICKTSHETGFDQNSIDHTSKNEDDKMLDFRTSESLIVDIPCDLYKESGTKKKLGRKLLGFRTSKENEEMLDFRISANGDSTFACGDGSKKFNLGGKFRTTKHRRRCNTEEMPTANDCRTDHPSPDGIDFRTSKRALKENDPDTSPSVTKSDISRADLALEEKCASKNARKNKKGRRTFAEALENGQETSVFATEESNASDGWLEIKTKHKRKFKGTLKQSPLNTETTNYDADEQSPSPDSGMKQKEFKINHSTYKHEEKEGNDAHAVIESSAVPPITEDRECFDPSSKDEGSELDFSNVMFELD